MTFRITGKESLLGGPPPEGKRHEQWIKEELAQFDSVGRAQTAQSNAIRESRVHEYYQAGVGAGEKARAERISSFWEAVRTGDIVLGSDGCQLYY